MAKPVLYIFCGFPFSGKTSLTKQIANKFGITIIDIDEVKRDHVSDVYDDNVTGEQWNKIFSDYFKRIKNVLGQGKSAISDNSSPTKEGRDELRALAKEENAQAKVVFLNTPADVVRQRWLANKKTMQRFDITEQTLEEALEDHEDPDRDENVILIDYRKSLEEQLKTFESLR